MNKNIISVLLLLLVSSAGANDQIVINGLSKHFNTELDRNSYNYGLGYIRNSHELGFYRNSRKPTKSYSVYYSYNKELTTWKSIPLGYRVGVALYDDKGKYNYYVKPIVAGYADLPITDKVKVRVSGTYNLIGAQLIINYK